MTRSTTDWDATVTCNGLTDRPADTAGQQRVLRQLLVAAEMARFFEEYFKSRKQERTDEFDLDFVANFTSCESIPSAAVELQSACVTFSNELAELDTTIKTVQHVGEGLQTKITNYVKACGREVACVLEERIVEVKSELAIATARVTKTHDWVDTLESWMRSATAYSGGASHRQRGRTKPAYKS